MDLQARRALYKQGTSIDTKEKRRQKLHAKQISSRQDRCWLILERVAKAADDGADEGPSESSSGANAMAMSSSPTPAPRVPATAPLAIGSSPGALARLARASKPEANQLMIPQWLVSLPDESTGTPLGDGWTVVPKPSGTHCLIIAKRDFTVVRDKHGVLMAKFSSALQGPYDPHYHHHHHHGSHGSPYDHYYYHDAGSAAGAKGGSSSSGAMTSTTILQAVFQEDTSTFAVLDTLLFNGQPTIDWPYEQRRFWLSSYLSSSVGRVRIPDGVPKPSSSAAVSAPSASAGIKSLPSFSSAAHGTTATTSATARVLHHGLKPSHNNSVLSGSITPTTPNPSSSSFFGFELATAFPCDIEGLKQAYAMACGRSSISSAPSPSASPSMAAGGSAPGGSSHSLTLPASSSRYDGLLFYDNAAAYDAGPTNCVLRWRDSLSSPFAQQPSSSLPAPPQLPINCILEAMSSGSLATRGFAATTSTSSAPPSLAASLLLSAGMTPACEEDTALASSSDAPSGAATAGIAPALPLAAEVAMLTGEDVSSYGITPGDLVHVTADDIEVVSQPQPTSDGTTNAGPALPGAAGEIIVAGSFSGSRSGAGSVPRRSDSIEMRSNSGGMAMSPGRADSSPSIIASGGGMASSATAAAEAATTFRLVNAKVVGKATDRRRTHADLLSKLLFASLEAKGRAVSIRDLAASLTGAKPALR